MTEAPVFQRLAIIGTGLIGASIAHAVRAYGGAADVNLFDAHATVRARAARLLPGNVTDTMEAAIQDADCVLLCTPVGTLAELTAAIAPYLKSGAILSDVGSVKGKAATDMAAACPPSVHLIPGHPIAGTEKSGPEAGFASLFQDAWHILTPSESQDVAYLEAVERLAAFWRGLGANVEYMPVDKHDRVLAITSHLPHLIAFNIVATAYDMETG